MAYEPTEWKKGDTITAEKLNKAENGIAGALTAEIPEDAYNAPDSYTFGLTYAEDEGGAVLTIPADDYTIVDEAVPCAADFDGVNPEGVFTFVIKNDGEDLVSDPSSLQTGIFIGKVDGNTFFHFEFDFENNKWMFSVVTDAGVIIPGTYNASISITMKKVIPAWLS